MESQSSIEHECKKSPSDKHTDCAHSCEEWDDIKAAQPLLRKVWRWIRLRFHWWLKNPYDASIGRVWTTIKRRGRLAIYGYDPNEWWSHHYVVSHLAIRHLQTMRDRGHGVPPDCNATACPDNQAVSMDGEGREDWQAKLDDMIFFHKVSCDEMEPRAVTYTSSFGETKGQPITFERNPGFRDLTFEEQKRYRRGKWLYFKHFEQLWD